MINMAEEVGLVLFLDKIPRYTDLYICQSMMGLSFSLTEKGYKKKGDLLMTSV